MRNLPISEHSRPSPRIGTQPVNVFLSLLQADLDDVIAQLKCDMDVLNCVPEAGDRPVRENADPAKPGAAGDRPVRGNADPDVSKTGRATAGNRDTAGDRPVRENADVKVLSETPMQTTQSRRHRSLR